MSRLAAFSIELFDRPVALAVALAKDVLRYAFRLFAAASLARRGAVLRLRVQPLVDLFTPPDMSGARGRRQFAADQVLINLGQRRGVIAHLGVSRCADLRPAQLHGGLQTVQSDHQGELASALDCARHDRMQLPLPRHRLGKLIDLFRVESAQAIANLDLVDVDQIAELIRLRFGLRRKTIGLLLLHLCRALGLFFGETSLRRGFCCGSHLVVPSEQRRSFAGRRVKHKRPGSARPFSFMRLASGAVDCCPVRSRAGITPPCGCALLSNHDLI